MRINKHFNISGSIVIILSLSLFCGVKPVKASECTSESNICSSCDTCGGDISCKTNPGNTCNNINSYTCFEDSPHTTCELVDGTACTSTSYNCCMHKIYETFYCCDPTRGDTCGPSDPNSGNPSNNTSTSPSTVVTPSDVFISGSIQKDINAAVSGSFCSQATNSPLTGIDHVYASNQSGTTLPTNYVGNTFTINTSYVGSNYTVYLDLSSQSGTTNYVCSCPAAIDPSNPYLCRYSGVGSPNNNVNFYLKEYNLSNNSWFQIFGGNLFGQTGIASPVPYTACSADGSCQAALSVPKAGSSNKLSSGFPITNTINSSSIKSSYSGNLYHSYLNLADRISNINSYSMNTGLAPIGYDYLYKLAENSAHQIGSGEDLEPLFSDWTSSSWWNNTDINYVKINGNVSIEETQGFNLSSSQKLVVFVDGNLTINDSDTNDTNRKITQVAEGGFLAFFVSGNILITPNVGYELNPSIPTVPIVTNANSNVEGVFVASGSLTIQSKNAIGEVPPDKKFIGAGTFVGWTAVNLNRTFNDESFGPILNNNQAIENFIYRPDLLANWPTKLKASISNWKEVDPQLINQQ